MKEIFSPGKVIAFDFDGVLANSHDQLISVFHELVREMNLPVLKDEELRRLGARSICGRLGLGPLRTAIMVKKAQKKLTSLPVPEAVPGVSECISTLAKTYRLALVSTSYLERINPFLRKSHLREYFQVVVGGASLWGKSGKLQDLWSQLSPSPSQSFYVGDEERDIEAARIAGWSPVAVSWGMRDRALLAGYGPDYLVDSPRELLGLFAAISQS